MAITRKTFYGSGRIYEFEYIESGASAITIPTTQAAIKAFVEEYAVEANQIGFLKNGFQVQINATKLEDQSDLGEMKISVISKEEGTMTFALFNSNGETISRLYPTAKTTDGVTVVGGLNGTEQKNHVILFVAADEAEGKTVFIGIGKNTSGFTLNWNPDSVEPFACEYSIIPYNTDGNLLVVADLTKE